MYDVVVLGAGVYGLTIATDLANRGVRVAVVARDLPEDVTSTGFASPWAGCNWCSFEVDGNTPAAEWDAITFKALGRLAETHPNLCKRIPFYDLWNDEKPLPWYHDLVFNAKLLKATEDHPLPGGFKHGVAFESYILHAPNYLAHLADGLRARGVPIIRRRLASIDEAFDLPETGRVDIVVNALGLGNKTLIGVMDDKMHPAQGQTVLVKAPLVNTCTMATGDTVKTKKEGEGPGVLSYEAEGVSESGRTHAGDNGQNVRALCNAIAHDDDDAISTTAAPSTSGRTPGTSADIPGDPEAIAYIIPRPGHEGHVVCGGTYNKDNWITQPNMAEAERILRACYALDPRLAGPNSKSWQDIEVVSHNVGLRPSRVGGVRLELERRIVGGTSQPLAPRSRTDRQRGVAVVHAYGPGGTGYQSSIGLAQKAGDIVVAQMRATPAAPKL